MEINGKKLSSYLIRTFQTPPKPPLSSESSPTPHQTPTTNRWKREDLPSRPTPLPLISSPLGHRPAPVLSVVLEEGRKELEPAVLLLLMVVVVVVGRKLVMGEEEREVAGAAAKEGRTS